MYNILDVNFARDLKTGKILPGYRTRVGGSYEGCEPDYGHCLKRVFKEEKLMLGRVTQEAGLSSPELPGFVYHSQLTEIEYVLTSDCLFTYPDGTKHITKARECFLHLPNQPHRLLSSDKEHVKLAVSFNGIEPDRNKWDEDAYYSQEGGHTCVYCPDVPNVDVGIPNLEYRPVFEGPGHHSFAEVTLKPDCCIPQEDYQVFRNADQILLVTGPGNGVIEFPDRVYKIYNDIAIYIFAGQPYRLYNFTDSNLDIAVWTSLSYFKDVGCETVKL